MLDLINGDNNSGDLAEVVDEPQGAFLLSLQVFLGLLPRSDTKVIAVSVALASVVFA
jgi:hypothetical protein